MLTAGGDYTDFYSLLITWSAISDVYPVFKRVEGNSGASPSGSSGYSLEGIEVIGATSQMAGCLMSRKWPVSWEVRQEIQIAAT